MGKRKQQFMKLNRETAMRLWNRSFGKDMKAYDFAGRVIAKGAYNDRNSKFGWNVDHILPQSKGGATADYNLVCCHISTNDEKADKFPCFTANGTAFEIVRVQNHYEIKAKNKKKQADENIEPEEPDFFDPVSGVRFFKKLKGVQNKKRFVGTVFIKLRGLTNTAVVDFIEALMCSENISFKAEKSYVSYDNDLIIVARNYDMPLKGDISELLDRCVLLNTWLRYYFVPLDYVNGYNIYYRVNCFDNKASMYRQLENINWSSMTYSNHCNGFVTICPQNTLFVNEHVLKNIEASKKVEGMCNTEYTDYDFIFTKLSNNLKKEANGK